MSVNMYSSYPQIGLALGALKMQEWKKQEWKIRE